MKKRKAGGKPSKKLQKELEVIEANLNEKQKLFVQLYTTDKFCFGNASKSYIEAYGLTTERAKNAARNSAYHLLTNPHVQKYKNKLLDQGFKEDSVDRELSKVVTQDKDLRAKVSAIDTYNKLKNRIKESPQLGPINIHIAPEMAAKLGLA